MEKVDRTVVRNQPYQRNSIGIRERHNERKNQNYSNPDIELERSHLNMHFRKCDGTYTQTLDKMLAEGIVSTKGLKADAKLFEEMVFDINTAYFENHGGYDYAKQFFEEAYHFAEKEVGSQYILSAVMHADERNRSLSDELGKDVYHYHLHVVYLPVVETVKYWSKRNKDKSLAGKPKEVFQQISHSKKWAFVTSKDEFGNVILDRNGKPKRIPSYSLLQDRFFNYMRCVGFKGFERGVKGSTSEHLSDLNYKIKQDTAKLTVLDEKIKEQQNDLSVIHEKIENATETHSSLQAIGEIGKRKWSGKVELTKSEYEDLSSLAKEGITSRTVIQNLHSQLNDARRKIWALNDQFNALYEATREFRKAMKIAPQKVKAFFTEIKQKAKEERELKKLQRNYRTKSGNVR